MRRFDTPPTYQHYPINILTIYPKIPFLSSVIRRSAAPRCWLQPQRRSCRMGVPSLYIQTFFPGESLMGWTCLCFLYLFFKLHGFFVVLLLSLMKYNPLPCLFSRQFQSICYAVCIVSYWGDQFINPSLGWISTANIQ